MFFIYGFIPTRNILFLDVLQGRFQNVDCQGATGNLRVAPPRKQNKFYSFFFCAEIKLRHLQMLNFYYFYCLQTLKALLKSLKLNIFVVFHKNSLHTTRDPASSSFSSTRPHGDNCYENAVFLLSQPCVHMKTDLFFLAPNGVPAFKPFSNLTLVLLCGQLKHFENINL